MRGDLPNLLREPSLFEVMHGESRDPQQVELWFEAYRVAKLHADVFSTEAGEELLKRWISVFLTRPIVRPGEDAFSQGIREGQADVIRQILYNIELARTGPPGEQT